MVQQSIGLIALEYTLIGMGVVFLVLVFISFIIGLFKFIPGSGSARKAKAEEPMVPTRPEPLAVSAAELSAVPAAPAASDDPSDDGQLVAVITAAIMAYMNSQGVQGDGYVVRSIRRR